MVCNPQMVRRNPGELHKVFLMVFKVYFLCLFTVFMFFLAIAFLYTYNVLMSDVNFQENIT